MEYIYAALLLHKLGKPIDEENLIKVLHSTGATIDESKVKSLVTSLKGLDIDAELANASNVSMATVSTTATESAAKKEEPKEEKRAEESAAGLSALFGFG